MTNFYISFGQVHAHSINGRTYDKDSLMLVQADNEINARLYVNAITGGKWSSLYWEEELVDFIGYFPRGVLNRDAPIMVEAIVEE
jgi:hypothetical protein